MVMVRGYSLIEVLVAMMLLALVQTVLMSTFSTSLRNVDTAQDYSRAMLLAESRLASLGVSEPLRVGESTGEEGGLTWQVQVADFADDDGSVSGGLRPQAYSVQVTVSWPATAGRNRQVKLSSLKLDQGADP